MNDLQNRTFLVTGASSGIGLALVDALAARGSRVVLAMRSPERTAAALDQVRRRRGAALLRDRPELGGVSGRYYNRCREARCNPLADDPLLGRELWDRSESIVS
jgi:NAD(P)-dependent dehydrogenase (short-subunit alcohol dehydrogenase family)